MNDLKVFNYEGNNIRTLSKDGDVWFVGKDVCGVLDIQNTTDALKRLDEDEVTRLNLGGLSGETNFISESGLYSLVLGSRKPEAKQFKRWVTHEVIPSIRKHGVYMTGEVIEKTLNDPDFIIGLATKLKEEKEARKLAEIKTLELQEIIEVQKPMVVFANACEASEDSMLIRDFSKILQQNGVKMGDKKFREYLKENGYLCKYGECLPTQRATSLKLFKIKKTAVLTSSHDIIKHTVKITGKGQVYFLNKLLKKAV